MPCIYLGKLQIFHSGSVKNSLLCPVLFQLKNLFSPSEKWTWSNKSIGVSFPIITLCTKRKRQLPCINLFYSDVDGFMQHTISRSRATHLSQECFILYL